jgi:hypothetical protein
MLASGGFGCVFRPALKCQGETTRDPNKVSKLMTTKHAKEELNEIENMKNKLKGIPNYQDYYLVEDFSICKPAELDEEDLQNFENCHALSKRKNKKRKNANTHLTVNDVNDNLGDLQILNMPFGGVPVDDFVKDNITNMHLMRELNNKLLDLLKHGIIPLNRNHIYHNDIKDSNVLVKMDDHEQNNNNMKTRLIDWGLSCSYKPNDPLPKSWKNRPFQFNVPFSVILFTDLFKTSYDTFKLNTNTNTNINATDDANVERFVKKYITAWKKKRGDGHMSYIKYIFKIMQQNGNSETYIVNYIGFIVKALLEDKMSLTDYLNNVFIKIMDVWGFVTLYIPLLDMLYKNSNNLSESDKNIYALLIKVFMTYLYSPRIEEININDLVNDLEKINTFIKK